MINVTFFEAAPEGSGRFEVVVHPQPGFTPSLTMEILEGADIPVRRDCVMGHFAVELASPEALKASQSLMIGDVVPLHAAAA